MSLSFEGQNLPANQISLTYLNPRLIYNYFRFGNTDVRHIRILFFFDCNFNNSRRAILHQSTKFRTNRATRGGVMTSYTISRWRPRRSILLPVSYLMMSLSSKGQFLSANQTSSTYLNPRLRYNYFRFGKTTVRHIEILLPVSILTTSPYSACHSTLG